MRKRCVTQVSMSLAPACESPETATTVGFQDGRRLVQDGPIASVKEQLGGLFMIDVPDLDAALDWAARCPSSPGRRIEVRPNLQEVN